MISFNVQVYILPTIRPCFLYNSNCKWKHKTWDDLLTNKTYTHFLWFIYWQGNFSSVVFTIFILSMMWCILYDQASSSNIVSCLAIEIVNEWRCQNLLSYPQDFQVICNIHFHRLQFEYYKFYINTYKIILEGM